MFDFFASLHRVFRIRAADNIFFVRFFAGFAAAKNFTFNFVRFFVSRLIGYFLHAQFFISFIF